MHREKMSVRVRAMRKCDKMNSSEDNRECCASDGTANTRSGNNFLNCKRRDSLSSYIPSLNLHICFPIAKNDTMCVSSCDSHKRIAIIG